MDQQKNSERIITKIENLVKSIQEFDGTSGHRETEWRKDQQELLRLLSENPLDLYTLKSELKKEIEGIVNRYLNWSFNAYW